MKRLFLVMIAVSALMCGCKKALAPSGDATPHPRVVSLSPSLTQMLFDMGLGEHVVGVTTQDKLPAGQARPVVGDAFSVNTEAVQNTEPDVVMIQMNPSRLEGVRRLCPKVQIEHFKIETLEDLAAAMERSAALAGNAQAGKDAAAGFRSSLKDIRRKVEGRERPRVLFITDFETLGTAGRGTFIDDMIHVAGGANVAANYTGWALMTTEGILAGAPDIVICQVNPGQEEHALAFWKWLKDLPAVKSGRLFMVTDRRWTIPSKALVGFTSDLAAMIHPETREGGS
ncbi:MAG: helical backbone metal receptor [Phycisphaerae bacterium]